MLKLLAYLLSQRKATLKDICPALEPNARGLPTLTDASCSGQQCNACTQLCPTNAIDVLDEKTKTGSAKVRVDLGACIGCTLCFTNCPTGTIAESRSNRTASKTRDELVLTNDQTTKIQGSHVRLDSAKDNQPETKKNPFANSLHVRVVSTGCSACDLEIGATGNPLFDLERFGIHIVASPRFADALMVTGPVGKGMQEALVRCYEAMAEPKLVVAVGTCAISGGVHRGGYAQGNGVDQVLPVDIYIPGCPPHPWQIVYGTLLAMGRENLCAPEEKLPAGSPTQENLILKEADESASLRSA